MALGVRGFNPIWANVDLQGKLFDDTFYLFVLENTIPYIPATVYHDPDLSIPWTQPIQYLANGTLPDIFYDDGKVYRLEWRQGNTQEFPLIYERNDYVPGTGGSGAVDQVGFISSNQVTNPQFSLYNLSNPYTFSGTDPDPIQIGPGWSLELAGTGTVIITQVSLDKDNTNPSNAPYALQLTLTGWTADSVKLKQRFEQNGMLWADQFVSTVITAKLGTTVLPQSISADLYDSQGAFLGNLLNEGIDSEWNEYTGVTELGNTTNENDPPDAYIEYVLSLPSTVDIYLTSIQLCVENLAVRPSFQQDSINRQIDHSYNFAYPIIPVGTVIPYGGFITSSRPVPAHYLLCDYSVYSRLAYHQLFEAITNVETVTLTNGVFTFTVSNGADYRIGMGLEGTGIPANTIITAISGNIILMSLAATITGPSAVRFFASNQTYTETVSLTNGSNTFIVTNGSLYQVGMLISGTGIPPGTTITNIAVNTITMSGNAVVSPSPEASLISFYSIGNGNGSTTFNVYGMQGRVIAGTGADIFGTAAEGLGSSGGSAFFTPTINHMANHNHTPASVTASPNDGASTLKIGGNNGSAINYSASLTNKGGGIPFSIVQPTTLMNYIIRYE